MAPDQAGPPMVLSRSTLVPAGVAASVMIAVISLTLWLGGRFSDLEYSVQALGVQVERLQVQLERGQTNAWTRDQQMTWAELLKARNPALVVPDVR